MCFLNLGVKGRNLARIVTTEPPAIRCNTKHVNKNSLLAAEPIQDVDKNRMPKQTKKNNQKKKQKNTSASKIYVQVPEEVEAGMSKATWISEAPCKPSFVKPGINRNRKR